MRFCFLRFIQLLWIGMLTVFAGVGHPIAQTANQASAQNGQASDQAKTQEVRPPVPLTPEPLNKKEVVFSRHDDVIPSVAFSPDGRRLASAGDNCVKITDLETGKELLKLKNSRGMSYFSVAFSSDGRTLAGAQSMLKERTSRRTGDTVITTLIYFGEVLVWDAQTGAIKIRLNDDDGPAWALAFSPDGKWLAVATGPRPEEKNCKDSCPAFGEITLWETGSWKLIRAHLLCNPVGFMTREIQLLTLSFRFTLSCQRQCVKRIARADDQILLAVQHPRRRPITHRASEALVPEGIAVGGIKGDEFAGVACKQQPACGGQNAAAHSAAAPWTAATMFMFPLNGACPNVHSHQRRG